MFRRLMFTLVALALTVGAARTARADTVTLKVATLAPEKSPWGKVFRAWQKGIKDQSKGAVEIQFFYGNQQGDEVAMVQKMRAGQLDGAAITATGLAQIYKSVLVLQLPGLYREWAALDAARNAMRPQLEKAFNDQNFTIVGWGDVGIAHLMTKGVEVRTPADLASRKCFHLKGDPIEAKLHQILGVKALELQVPEILPNLNAGSINVVNAPSLAADVLQWSSQLDHINTQASGIGIGALVFTSVKMNSLPADLKAMVLESGNRAGNALTTSIRNEDDAAYGRLKASMTTYEPSAAEQEQWKKVFEQTRNELKGKTFDANLFDRAVACSASATSAACTTAK